MSFPGTTIRALAVTAHSVGVLQRAGMINLLDPVGVVRASRAVRRYRASDPYVRLAAAALLERIPLRRNQTLVLAAPLFHGTALNQFIMAMSLGSPVVLRRRFDAEATLAAVASHRAQVLVLVPTMLRRMLELGPETLARYDTSALRVLFSAGSALPAALGDAATAAFGEVLYNFYGSTEVGVATISTPADWRAAAGTVGKPPTVCACGCTTSTVHWSPNPAGAERFTCAACCRSPATRVAVTRTRSTACCPPAMSGMEDLLYAHPGIAEAAVIAVPDDEFGQRLAAFIVVHPGATLDDDAARAYVKANLARFKVPRDVTFVDELPRTGTGKLLRRDLVND